MRKLKNSKHFGEIYSQASSPGSLTIFCPSCPQPGINLPPDWKNLPNWITRRTVAVDGNFHADHIKMRRPDLDIALSKGQGYMVEDTRYTEYLTVAQEPRLVRESIHLTLVYILNHPNRDHPVGTIVPSMLPTPIIDATWMLLVWWPAVVQGMDVSSPLPSVIYKKEKGEQLLDHVLLERHPFLMAIIGR
jgi:hypothetical protein